MTAPATDTYQQVYDEYLEKSKDPAWKFAMEVFLGELMQENAVYHQAQIQAICDWAAERQLNRHKSAITKRYLLDRMEEVQKRRRTGPRPTAAPSGSYSGWNETMWNRSRNGQFARYVGPSHLATSARDRRSREERVVFEPSPTADPRSVISRGIAQRSQEDRAHPASNYGLLNRPEALPAGVSQSQHSVDVAHMFDRMTWSLANKTGSSEDKQRVQFVISAPDGHHRVVTPKPGVMPDVDFGHGERVSFMTPVGPDKPVTIAGQAVNIGHIAGMSDEEAAKTGAVAADVHGALTKASWGDKLQHTSNALRVISNNSPAATQAHAVASLFNILGPDASRAFGNKLKQLTYRYLGQEVPSDRYSPIARRGRQVDGKNQLQGVRDYERQLAHDLVPSIPSSTEYNLALQAGSSPPSRGYILNDDGRVVSEAVGYADDWYTPFNLKKLPQMRGGSYVRTRGYGGLTPEDIRLAMRTGAKRATVISNNGVFTMEFEPRALHWGHRFGFVGNGLIRRYAKALDAIQHKQVTQVDGENGKLALDTQGYLVAMKDLQRQNPQWIVADNSQVPFHQSLREFGNIDREEVIGEGSKDKGYMGPLSLHADAAMSGWAGENLRELWSDKTGKYAWSSVDRGRVHSDLGVGVVDRLRGNGNNGDGGFSGGSSTLGGGPRNGGGGGGALGADDRSKVNRFGIRRGFARVDSEGLLRDVEDKFVDHAGKPVTWQQAKHNRESYKRTNPELTRVGGTVKLADDLYSTRPVGMASADPGRTGGVPATTLESEKRERSHHWSEDDAVSTGQDVRDTMLRLKELGHDRDFKNWKALGEAHAAMVAPGDGYSGTTEYSNFIEKLKISPTFRKQLATDLEDAIDGRHLSSETTNLEPGQMLATLRDTTFDPAAVSPHSSARADDDGDNYASIELDGHRPVIPAELEGSKFVQAHVRKLEGTARNGLDQDAKDKAKVELDEHRAYMRLTRKIADMRKARPQLTLDEIFAREPAAMRELYDRQNHRYSQMIQHGTLIDSENVPSKDAGFDAERTALKGETVPSTTRLMDGSTTQIKALPHRDELIAGRMTPQSAADSVFDKLHEQFADNPGRLRQALRMTAKQYESAAEFLHRNGHREAGAKLFETSEHLSAYGNDE